MRSAEYHQRLNDPSWQQLRHRLIRERGGCCERCGGWGILQLHHKTYERLGRELDTDLEVLCPPCHETADAERAAAAASRHYYRRLDGWASKVYGDNWEYRHDSQQIEDRFEDWLDGRDE